VCQARCLISFGQGHCMRKVDLTSVGLWRCIPNQWFDPRLTQHHNWITDLPLHFSPQFLPSNVYEFLVFPLKQKSPHYFHIFHLIFWAKKVVKIVLHFSPLFSLKNSKCATSLVYSCFQM
jgi:hypothetical protein